VIVDALAVPAATFAAGTGWDPKPEGLCRGEVCVPAPGSLRADGLVDVEVAAAALGMPVVGDPARSLWAVGPRSDVPRLEPGAPLPDLTLIDRQGDPVSFSGLLGRRMIMVAWATW
jgi:hypothetical protein